jgi:hypothetical protein
MQTTQIAKQLANNPLLLTQFTETELETVMKSCCGKNIFFGTGIMTSNQLSVDTPFDILGFFFTAEQIARMFNSQKIVVLIADQHATTNKLFPEGKIQELTEKTIQLFKKIKRNFQFKKIEIIRTTTLNSVPEIRAIYANLPTMENDYLKHEIADSLWLHEFHNVEIKLGWAMSSSAHVEGHDERFFDTSIKNFCPDMTFFHLKPGRTFDVARQRVSPYISVDGESRILLKEGESVTQKLAQFGATTPIDAFKATKRQLAHIARLHDTLFEPIKFSSLEDRLQHILEKAIK